MDVSHRQVVNVLAREGEYWTIIFAGRVLRLRDAKGIHYLDQLVRRPGEEVHALTLVSLVESQVTAPPGDAGTVLDAKAVAAYRERFRDLRDELDEAEGRSDYARAERIQEEMDALSEQLSAGLGLGGRHRRAGSPTERARLAVTKALRSAIRRLSEADPQLGQHLDRTVRTGTFCSYAPDPAVPFVWSDKPAEDPALPRRGAAGVTRDAGRSPYVGRLFERELVTERVAAVAGGRGGLLLLRGEAGIGKTRLVEEALRDAGARGIGGFVGRCVEGDMPVAWLPVVEILEQATSELADAELLDVLGGAGVDVARVLPSLRRRLPDLPPPPDVPPEQGRQSLFLALRDLVLRIGERRPAVLVLEDVHWADAATLQLLQHVVDWLEPARALIIATYRDDEAPLGSPLARVLERLVRHPACASIHLGPLGESEVTDLIEGLTGRSAPARLSQRLWAGADGNPFFLEQLLKHLADGQALYDDRGELRDDVDDAAMSVPDGLRLILGHRLRRLSSTCREVVNLAAVAGRDVDLELLAAAAGTQGVGVLYAFDDAIGSGVLISRAGTDDRLGFSHALLRRSALEQLTSLRRRQLHLRVADALRRRHGKNPQHAAEVADHLEQAGNAADPAVTVQYLALAAHRSLQSFAYEDAEARFQRALALVGEGGGGGGAKARAELLAGVGYAQRGLGRADQAKTTWLEVLSLIEREGRDPDQLALAADICRSLGRFLDATGGLNDAVAVLERGLRLIDDGSEEDRSQLLSALGYVRGLSGDLPGGEAAVESAAAIAERLDDDRRRADVLATRTTLAFMSGRLADCVSLADNAEAALLKSGQVWDAITAQVTTAWPRLWLGRVDDASRQVARVLALAERVGHQAAVFLSRRTAALVEFMAGGNLARFEAETQAGVQFCEANRLRWLADAHGLAGLARFWIGDWDAAEHHLRMAATLPAPPVYAGRYGATLLTFLAWKGDGEGFDTLHAELEAALAQYGLRSTLGATAVLLAAVEGYAVLGRSEEAARLYPAVVAALDDGLVLRPPDFRIVQALAGLAAGLGGDERRCEGHFDEARRQVAALPHPRQAPDVDFLQAVSLGHGPRAATLLARAAEGYAALGMTKHRMRAETEAQAAS